MKIEIITIGDEILIGQIVDTNSAWLGRKLTAAGFEITAITTVGDCANEITAAIDHAFERADILLLTGGVGPTNDDITKHTLCSYFHTALQFNEEVLQNIESIFLSRNISLNQLTRNQAYVPSNCKVIQNSVGTAPILWFDKDDKVLISMPGVPFEMKTAMQNSVIPLLEAQFGVHAYLRRSYLVTGITESSLAILLSEFEEQLPSGLSLAYLPSFGYIRLRLSAWGKEKEPEIKQWGRKLKQILGTHLAGKGEKMPSEILAAELQKKKYTVSTAESCTGGGISYRLALVPGASEYYKGSIVSYSNDVKEAILGVSLTTIDTHGAVSRETAEEMVNNIIKKMHTDCGIAVSGIMGPDGGTKSKPVGTVWIATYCKGQLNSKKYSVGRSREENIDRTCNLAILQLLEML